MMILPLSFDSLKNKSSMRRILILATIFYVLMLVFALNRFYSFYASYDQGLFEQLFWNTIHGNLFQGSLSSGQSSAVIADGQVHQVFYCHLGQHFVIDFLLWMPLYALFPSGATLVVLQVTLITMAGLVLYALARHYLPGAIAFLITASYYGANAVIGPTFANFYEHCQIPLFVFSLLLCLEKRKWWLFWLFVILILGIREDTGIILFGIGLYLIFTRRYLPLGITLCLLGFSYIALLTNVVMPLFSNDNSRLYLSGYFSKFAPGNPHPNTLQIFWGIVTHPQAVFESFFIPFDKRIKYFLGQWLPLAFIPAISTVAWIITAPPLLVLLIEDNKLALSMSVRFALTLVPGLFYGVIIWWSQHQIRFKPVLRRWWTRCIVLSLIIAVASSPNHAFYFLIPESVQPWVYIPLTRQWNHVKYIHDLMKLIPANASVSATTSIIPHLANRRGIIRLPALKLEVDKKQIIDVDYALADLWEMQQIEPIYHNTRQDIENFITLFDQLLAQKKYGLVGLEDGVILLEKNITSNLQAVERWLEWKQKLQSKKL